MVNFGIDSNFVFDENNKSVSTRFNEYDDLVEQLNTKLGSFVIPQMFGGVGDGITDDTQAVRDAIKHAEDNKVKLIIPSVFVITGELEIKKPIVIEGIGSGIGYGNKMVQRYTQTSGLLVKGTGEKRLRTRRKYRASVSDPADDKLSVVLNVQCEGVSVRDLSIRLDGVFVESPVENPTNYGYDWDCGIFVGSRTHFTLSNVHVVGYFRVACFYYDVTHQGTLPRFNDINDVAYPDYSQQNSAGGDGCTMYKCLAFGGKWGVFVAGAIRKEGETVDTYDISPPPFYDELTGTTVDDNRGSFGFSDFTMYSCNINGTEHHSYYRRDAHTGDYETDPAGGAMFIDGMAGNASGMVQGMRFFSSRFATWEPYIVKLDRSNRAQFYGCHFEGKGSSNVYNPDGSLVDFDNFVDQYDYISCTMNTNNVLTLGCTTHKMNPGDMGIPYLTNWTASTAFSSTTIGQYVLANSKIYKCTTSGTTGNTAPSHTSGFANDGSVTWKFVKDDIVGVELHNLFITGSTDGSTTTDVFKALRFVSIGNRYDAFDGELDLRSGSDTTGVRMRAGSATQFRIDPVIATAYMYAHLLPNTDNARAIGSSSNRWTEAHLKNGVVVTTPDGTKKYRIAVDNAGAITTTLVP